MRCTFTALATMLALGVDIPSAIADSPHFVGNLGCDTENKNNVGLICSGKVAGLGSTTTFVFLTADQVTATFECVNRGGNVAPGQPVVEEDVTGPVSTFPNPRKGQITFSVKAPSAAPSEPARRMPQWQLDGAPDRAELRERRAARPAVPGDAAGCE
ncbi:hypothetical protein [Streptomyces sp. NBC_00996]|uniref:hypothetical protein n=1 Tax=Streptomyces sp. NBC_00996 TaxID=2903710 RepID=UPI00386B4BDD|nr:hypothetical protein OG390_17795 [Streptomyces sp. NBC_00996]